MGMGVRVIITCTLLISLLFIYFIFYLNQTPCTNTNTMQIVSSDSIKFKVFDIPQEGINDEEFLQQGEEITRLKKYWLNNCTKILMGTDFTGRRVLKSRQEGFVHTVLRSYSNHHNLVIRPDDVWLAILTQFSFYVNGHSEQFRSQFVNFTGKKELVVEIKGSGIHSAAYDLGIKWMTETIDKNIIDKEFKAWILPNFTTSTDSDLLTSGAVFMATMKTYFEYEWEISCGIPWITLEGTIEDWQEIYRRISKLKFYKLEKWFDLLEPVLNEFVKVKNGCIDLEFWQQIAHHQESGYSSKGISGWVTVFSVFDKHGNWIANMKNTLTYECRKSSNKLHPLASKYDGKTWKWPIIEMDDIATGVVEVDVKIKERYTGNIYKSVLIAGHLGPQLLPDNYTLQSTVGWAVALKP